jgi:hypothetical protein
MFHSLRRRRRQTVSLDGRFSFTGDGSALLVLPGEALILSPDPFQETTPEGEPAHNGNSLALDRLADELTERGRFADALAKLGIDTDADDELIPVRVTFEVAS